MTLARLLVLVLIIKMRRVENQSKWQRKTINYLFGMSCYGMVTEQDRIELDGDGTELDWSG
jgi:hypothetical protein